MFEKSANLANLFNALKKLSNVSDTVVSLIMFEIRCLELKGDNHFTVSIEIAAQIFFF